MELVLRMWWQSPKSHLQDCKSSWSQAYFITIWWSVSSSVKVRKDTGRKMTTKSIKCLVSLWTNIQAPLFPNVWSQGWRQVFFWWWRGDPSLCPQIRPLTSCCVEVLKRLCFHFHAVQNLIFEHLNLLEKAHKNTNPKQTWNFLAFLLVSSLNQLLCHL